MSVFMLDLYVPTNHFSLYISSCTSKLVTPVLSLIYTSMIYIYIYMERGSKVITWKWERYRRVVVVAASAALVYVGRKKGRGVNWLGVERPILMCWSKRCIWMPITRLMKCDNHGNVSWPAHRWDVWTERDRFSQLSVLQQKILGGYVGWNL